MLITERSMGKKKISIYDTTLRDGAQTTGISFSLNDKLLIAVALDRLKIDYLEGGWPGSNPKDDQFFRNIRKEKIRHSKIVAFGSTKRKGVSCKADALLQSLAASNADAYTIVAKTWDFQVTHALNISLKENLALIYDTIAYLKDKGKEVFFDGEHFFDGFIANEQYSTKTIEGACAAGADMIVLCDTNGGTMPEEARRIVASAVREFNVPIGVHFHNDTGMAVANSLAAVEAGAVSVQGTANGFGERCGNTNLMTLIPNLVLKMGYRCNAEKSLVHLTEVSRFISETANLSHDERAPYVGANSFAHKAGLHVSGLQKDARTYEHMDPGLVGNKRKVLVSELSGKSNIIFKANEMGIDLRNRVSLPSELLQKIKSLEDQGFQFEAAEGSFEILIREAIGEYKPFFKLMGFRVISEMAGSKKLPCEATIKVEVGGVIEHTAANGYGPVEALDNALRKALEKFYPEIKEIQLSDYKVRVLDEKSGTGSNVRVLIDQRAKGERWGTVGVSADIIEASWQALVDGIEFMLLKRKDRTGRTKKP